MPRRIRLGVTSYHRKLAIYVAVGLATGLLLGWLT